MGFLGDIRVPCDCTKTQVSSEPEPDTYYQGAAHPAPRKASGLTRKMPLVDGLNNAFQAGRMKHSEIVSPRKSLVPNVQVSPFDSQLRTTIDELIAAGMLNGDGQVWALKALGWVWIPKSRRASGVLGRLGGWTRPGLEPYMYNSDDGSIAHSRVWKMEQDRVRGEAGR